LTRVGQTLPCVLEAASRADLDAIVALERACFSHPWSAHDLEAAMGDRERGAFLVLRAAERGGSSTILAYVILHVVLDEVSVLDLAVDPRWRRMGIGRWLLEQALALAARRGATVAYLEVRQSNWQALALYRSLGFEVVSARRDYYERPREDAFVLRKPGLARERESGATCDP
jgi:ribosomal-protein-alanine N-acetyltransferase